MITDYATIDAPMIMTASWQETSRWCEGHRGISPDCLLGNNEKGQASEPDTHGGTNSLSPALTERSSGSDSISTESVEENAIKEDGR